MATQGGAEVLGMGNVIGNFKAGKKLDCLVVDYTGECCLSERACRFSRRLGCDWTRVVHYKALVLLYRILHSHYHTMPYTH